MAIWKIPVCYQMMGTIEVEADTLAKAMKIAKDEEGEIPLPDDATYLDDSWELANEDEDYLRQFYNGNQEDNAGGETESEGSTQDNVKEDTQWLVLGR